MPTVQIPASFGGGTFRYNISGGAWRDPYQNMIAVGRTSGGTVYRAYMAVPGISSSAVIESVALKFRRTDSYSTKIWDIGLMTGAPGTSVSTANFAAYIANDYTTTRDVNHSISIPPATWGTPNQTKYIVWLGYSTSSDCYGEIGCSSSVYPYVEITYSEGTVRYGVSGNWQQCTVYYGVDGQWVQCTPQYGADGKWVPIGG